MTSLIALADDSIWHKIIQALSMNGLWVFIAVCVIVAAIKQVIQMTLKHREKIAMIEAGMSPDQSKDKKLDETLDYVERESE